MQGSLITLKYLQWDPNFSGSACAAVHQKKRVHTEPGGGGSVVPATFLSSVQSVFFLVVLEAVCSRCVCIFFSVSSASVGRVVFTVQTTGSAHTQLHTRLECYRNTREYFTCLLTNTHTHTHSDILFFRLRNLAASQRHS